MEPRVVVGLDGSSAARAAVLWAAWLSEETATPLWVVHAFTAEASPSRPTQELATEAWHRTEATQWLREALAESPSTPFSARLVVAEGAWEQVLLRHSPAGSMLVLGMTPRAAAAAAALRPDLSGPVVMVPARAVRMAPHAA